MKFIFDTETLECTFITSDPLTFGEIAAVTQGLINGFDSLDNETQIKIKYEPDEAPPEKTTWRSVVGSLPIPSYDSQGIYDKTDRSYGVSTDKYNALAEAVYSKLKTDAQYGRKISEDEVK